MENMHDLPPLLTTGDVQLSGQVTKTFRMLSQPRTQGHVHLNNVFFLFTVSLGQQSEHVACYT